MNLGPDGLKFRSSVVVSKKILGPVCLRLLLSRSTLGSPTPTRASTKYMYLKFSSVLTLVRIPKTPGGGTSTPSLFPSENGRHPSGLSERGSVTRKTTRLTERARVDPIYGVYISLTPGRGTLLLQENPFVFVPAETEVPASLVYYRRH